MPPFTIVKYFYIPKYVLAGLFPCHISFMIEHLTLDSAEEGLRTGIIIAVALPAHTANQAIFL